MLNLLRKPWTPGRFVLVLFALYAGQAFAQLPQGTHIKFENVADSTQGLSDFSQFPGNQQSRLGRIRGDTKRHRSESLQMGPAQPEHNCHDGCVSVHILQ